MRRATVVTSDRSSSTSARPLGYSSSGRGVEPKRVICRKVRRKPGSRTMISASSRSVSLVKPTRVVRDLRVDSFEHALFADVFDIGVPVRRIVQAHS